MSYSQTSSATPSDSEYFVRVVSDSEGLLAIRPFWEKLNHNPNTEPDFFALINEQRESIIRPQVLVIERSNLPVGLVIGRLVEQDFIVRIGYKSLKLARAREFHIINGGVLNASGPAEARAVFDSLMGALRKDDVDLVHASHIDVNSILYKELLRRPPFFCRDRLVRTKPHWVASLPGSAAEVVQRLSKKRRHWMRSLEKQLEKDFPGEIGFREFRDVASLAQLFTELEWIAKRTYQRGLGVGFINNDEFAKRMHFESEKGWLRAYVLYLKGNPVAFWVGNLYKNVFHSGMTGYDPHFSDYGVGSLVFIRMIESLCKEHVASIDFGLGDALYKQRFGDKKWTEANVRIFAPSLRGVLLNFIQTLFEGSAFQLRVLLERTGLLQRFKTLWRHRLASQDPENGAEKEA